MEARPEGLPQYWVGISWPALQLNSTSIYSLVICCAQKTGHLLPVAMLPQYLEREFSYKLH